MNPMQDILSKIANAKATKGGNRICDGDYEYLIESFGVNQGFEGTCFIAELRVTESKQTEPDIVPNPVGSTVSMVANVTKHASALGNVKAFILAAIGADESQVSAEAMQATLGQAIDPTQPLRGMKIRNRTFRKVNQGRNNPKNAGQVMTLNNFQHVPGQTGESIKAGRAYLDTNAATAAPQQSPQSTPSSPQQSVASPQPQPQVAQAGLLAGLGLGK